MAPTSAAQVREFADPVVGAAGLELADVTVTPVGRRSVVRLVVDGDGDLDLDTVAEVSRTIAEALDAVDAFGTRPYTLEVSSPGVDRPLTTPRHWRRALRRLVAAELLDGDSLTGRLVEADSASARLDVDGTVHEIAYADVRSARVQIEFARPPGGRQHPGADGGGIDGDDVDDVDEDQIDEDDDGSGEPDDEGDDVSQDLPENGPAANPANDVVGPEVDEMDGRDDDEQVSDLVEEDPDTTDRDAAPVPAELGTGSGRSGADVIGLDDDTAEDDPVELRVGPGTDDDDDRPVEDDLTDGNDEDGSDQSVLYRDDDDDPSDLSVGAVTEAADEGSGQGSAPAAGPTVGDPRAS